MICAVERWRETESGTCSGILEIPCDSVSNLCTELSIDVAYVSK